MLIKFAQAALLISGLVVSQAKASETIAYTYDTQGRLTNVQRSGNVNNGVQSTYTFDNADNRTNVTVTNANSRVIVAPINGLTVIPIPDP